MSQFKNPANLKPFLNEFSYYLVNFFMSLLIGFGLSILLDLPMKFIQKLNIDLGHFVIHILGMCIALYIRGYQKSYNANQSTYTFCFKKTLMFVFLVFAVQTLLVLILGVRNGGHAIYVVGPSRSLANYIQTLMKTNITNQYLIYKQLNWTFMIVTDIFIYAPLMIAGEYFGAKKSGKQIML